MTLTPEEAIQAKIAAVFGQVPGVKRAFERLPQTIVPADCPAVCSMPRDGRPTGASAPKMIEIVRNFVIQFFITPVQAGEAYDAEKAAIPWINTGMLTILAHPNLIPTPASSEGAPFTEVTYLGDSGLVVLPAGRDNSYLGVEFTISVKYRVPYSFAKYE